jgi:hypothetical protein
MREMNKGKRKGERTKDRNDWEKKKEINRVQLKVAFMPEY